MGSAFLGFGIATRGLDVARSSLNIINNNITNANTEGYSRQLATIRASRPEGSADGKGMQGTGADVVQIERQRDAYIDYKYWNESSKKGEYAIKEVQISQIEALFNEPSDSGFTANINSFFESFQKATANPSDSSVRESLKQSAVSVTNYFNSTAESLHEYQRELNFNIKTKVNEINSIADQMKNLNDQILKTEVTGDVANSLRDERDKLIDQLSSIVNISTDERQNGTTKDFIVKINNQVLVDGVHVNKLKVEVRTVKNNAEDADNLYDIKWDSGLSFDMYDDNLQGELKGYIDLRDGNNDDVTYKGIPHYMKRMDTFVRTISKAINEGTYMDGTPIDGLGASHETGYSKNGTVGNMLFAYRDNADNPTGKGSFVDYNNMTAKNFSVSAEVLDDIDNIVLSDSLGESSNNEVAESILKIKNEDSLFKEGKLSDYFSSLISEVAIDSKQAKQINSSQELVMKSIKNQRLSVSGVDVNEEVMNMVKFQHAYSASAKLLQVLNEIYDITINGLGV